MKQTLIENVKKDTSGKWISVDDAEQLINDVIAQAVIAVQNTGKQCAYTTHDLIAVECTIAKSVQALKGHFGVE